jgi:NADH:ubiquinone oxidoreductase subunit 5 (subunit L)/multisubunit Na+/H+ antiporter MnhA subunit
MVTLVYGRAYAAGRDMLRGGELFTLSLFALLGMFVMISGNNFLVIYMGIELLTLSSYALVALRRDDAVATEAAMKYFVLGALASGFLLYGMSMLYGATGSLDLHEVFQGHQLWARWIIQFWSLGWSLSLPVWRSTWGGSVSHVDTGCLSRCSDRCHSAGGWRTQVGCICGVHQTAGGRSACPWQSIGSKC